MLGREIADYRMAPSAAAPEADAPTFFSARGVTAAPGIADADVDIAEGEVLGFAGLLGSGRTPLARGLSGVDRLQSGIIQIEGRDANLSTPRRAMTLGVVYSPENRRTEGIISELSVLENITLSLQAQRGFLRRIRTHRQRELAASWVEALDIRPPDLDRPAGQLSGGNQQKLLLARLFAVSPRVLVLDEPTRGIDVGAKVEIQNLVSELASNGLSVVFVSAELEEVLRVGDRVTVLRDGRVVETVRSADTSVDQLLALVARPSAPQLEVGHG
jgi:simple sugar transport system ATP-binding protein